MKKELMKNAWEIAKEAAKKFGGKAIEYIAGAMKMAWAVAKAGNTSVAKFQAVEAKMHKAGAYYGIEVVADGDSIGTYYIAEKVWDVA